MKRSLAAVALLLLAWSTAMLRAADILPPVSERFAPEKTDEAPDFRHHVLPLMGRLGCNGRACHGSFQGQGGFRLSLFGYDAQMDYDALMKGDHPRVDPKNVDKSLFLLKPSKQVDHEGGRRMAVDSWQYRLIRRWIQAGAKPVPPKQADFDHLEITPPEIVFANRDEHRALRVVAVWKDGVREDVTPICRFRSNDDGICRIDAEGVVTSVAQGDTDVVAFYDNGVQPVPVILPVSKQVGDQYPAVAAPTKIDQLILEKLRKVGIVPSEVAGDAEFLRRLSLDMTGTLPQPPEVAAFLADTSSDKRAKKIDELLERPAYAAWWATRFSDWTGNNSAQLQQIFQNGGVDGAMISAQWYSWLFDRLQKNVDYDKIVQNILVSQSREPGESYRDYCAKMLRLSQGDPSEFAKNETMPYYWARQNFRKPDEAVVGFCYTFLGLQIQCAQCHKHPFDQWSKRDFDKFAGFFTRIGVGVKPDGWEDYAELSKDADIGKGLNGKALRQKLEELIKAGKSLPQREVYVGYKPGEKPPRLPKGDKAIRGVPPPPVGAATASVLGGPSVDLKTVEDPRQTLMDWMLHDPSRYFARSIVDRIWANYFGVGIVNPPDDHNLANPPSNQALLDYLTNAFIEHHYDLKWLHREITNSLAYQRTWKVNDTNRLDSRNFSHATARRLPAEVAYDAIYQATASDDELPVLQEKLAERAIGPFGGIQGQGRKIANSYVMTVFGKPARAATCDCERVADPSLLQTIYLQNDSEALNLVNRNKGFLQTYLKKPKGDFIQAAYLRTLSRYPTETEQAECQAFLNEAGNTGPRDLLWTLLNTKEFIVNH